jgi:mono/diheme cytochrome c family protein
MHQEARARSRFLILAVLSFSPATLLFTASQTPQAPSSAPAAAERDRLLGIGRKLFVERCASCHAEKGDKPLPTGLPLSERKLEYPVIEKAVKGRLKDKSPEEQRGVALYIESLRHR